VFKNTIQVAFRKFQECQFAQRMSRSFLGPIPICVSTVLGIERRSRSVCFFIDMPGLNHVDSYPKVGADLSSFSEKHQYLHCFLYYNHKQKGVNNEKQNIYRKYLRIGDVVCLFVAGFKQNRIGGR